MARFRRSILTDKIPIPQRVENIGRDVLTVRGTEPIRYFLRGTIPAKQAVTLADLFELMAAALSSPGHLEIRISPTPPPAAGGGLRLTVVSSR